MITADEALAEIKKIYDEIAQITAQPFLAEKYDNPATYKTALLALRDTLYGKNNLIDDKEDHIKCDMITRGLTNNDAENQLKKITAEFIPTKQNLRLNLFKTCVALLEIDDEFPSALQKTDKYLNYLESVIYNPYYNYEQIGKSEPINLYHQRLKHYLDDLENYCKMVLAGITTLHHDHSAYTMASNAKNRCDAIMTNGSENHDYSIILKRLIKYENIQDHYLDKIKQFKNKITYLLNHQNTTLSKILKEQQENCPVKKILITVSLSTHNINCHISGHGTNGHMMAILFDGDKPPVCISRFPIRNEKTKKYFNYQGNIEKREIGGVLGTLLKLVRLPHRIYPAVNVDFDNEINMQLTERRIILPPIVFYCNDNLGIDFDKALHQAQTELQNHLQFSVDNNCADPIIRMIEAGINEKDFELDSSRLMGITMPITLYKNLQKLHDEIQLKRNPVARKYFTQEQQKLETHTHLTKIDELKLNIKNARDTLLTISRAIAQVTKPEQHNQLDILILIQNYENQFNNLLAALENAYIYSAIDSGKLFLEIQKFISIEENRCKHQLTLINKDHDSPISADDFDRKSTNELIKLLQRKNIIIPPYFNVILIALTELLNTLPLPCDSYLEYIRHEILSQLPASPPQYDFNLDISVKIYSSIINALNLAMRKDNRLNLFLNAISLRNVILNIQNKHAKLTVMKLNLRKDINTQSLLSESLKEKMTQVNNAMIYCEKSTVILQNAFGKMNQYNYFDCFDLAARNGHPNPFVVLKIIFPSNNPYNHLQDLFNETNNIFPSVNMAKPKFWQFWKKYEYKKQCTIQYIKAAFSNQPDPINNFLAIKKKINELRPDSWDSFWLSNATLKQRKKHCNELKDKTYVLCNLRDFAQGKLSASELILKLKAMANKSASIYKKCITDLVENLTETHKFYKQQSQESELYQHERKALTTLTSTTAILLRCKYPHRSNIPAKDINASVILSLDEQMTRHSAVASDTGPILQENPADSVNFPDNLEEQLLSFRPL